MVLARRIVLVVVAAVPLAGCGDATVPAATTTLMPPASSSPRPDPEGAPNAWAVGAEQTRVWLRPGSSCWTEDGVGVCADYGEPVCGAPEVPELPVEPDGTIELHLTAHPVSVHVDNRPLAAAEALRVPVPGTDRILGVMARFPQGDASFAVCLRPAGFRAAP